MEDASCLTGVAEEADLPRELALHSGVPNPFQQATSIRYDLPSSGPVRLAVYDAGGRLLRMLRDRGAQPAGRFEAPWDGRTAAGEDAGTGVYFVRMEAGGRVLTRKLTLIR